MTASSPRRVLIVAAVALATLPPVAAGRTYIVDRNHPKAADDNPGSPAAPLKTISRAAALAGPGDTVRVHGGVYRERVAPVRGGEPGKPVVYRAAAGEAVAIRGSDLWPGPWEPVAGADGVYRTTLDAAAFRTGAPKGAVQSYNPFATPLQTRKDYSCGQVFADGQPLRELPDAEQLAAAPGCWTSDGKTLTIHLPRPYRRIDDVRVEISVRGRVFAPYTRGLGYIHVIGFRMAHCGNNFHAGFYVPGNRFPQAGALGCRGGNHWRIENCIIEHAKTTGIDCGYEGRHDLDGLDQGPGRDCGYHVIRGCIIRDNGAAGIVGCNTPEVQIVGNVIERNDTLGLGGMETGGIKLHGFTDGLIAENLIRENDTSGIWLDNIYRHSRVTRNVIIANRGAGLFLELGRGPLLVDNNILALSTAGRGLAGDGIYSHDAGGVTVAHNLIYFNGNFGVWAHVGTERRSRGPGASGWRVVNNIIIGNHRGAISLPAESRRSRDNHSDYNVLAGAFGLVMSETYGAPLDAPLLLVNSNKDRTSRDELVDQYRAALDAADVPAAERPNLARWRERPVLSLAHWRLWTGRDRHSRAATVLRPQLSREGLTLSFVLDDAAATLACPPLDGVRTDLLGRAIDATTVRPGPFQDLVGEPRLSEDDGTYHTPHRGQFEKLRDPATNRYRLWPLPGTK
ncbi:MAG: right-handed parallel beta-helix repeat-containing protein [Phycisphaerae bacterium]|nr:right-handed parallel beta-helix repeat-containing protein [Phycisphaerae bacterium]